MIFITPDFSSWKIYSIYTLLCKSIFAWWFLRAVFDLNTGHMDRQTEPPCSSVPWCERRFCYFGSAGVRNCLCALDMFLCNLAVYWAAILLCSVDTEVDHPTSNNSIFIKAWMRCCDEMKAPIICSTKSPMHCLVCIIHKLYTYILHQRTYC